MTTGAEVASAARRYLGTPFVHQGRALGAGVDCAGLLACVARDLGLPLSDCVVYARQPDPVRFMAELRARFEPTQSIEPGCALHFAYGRWPMHLGVALNAEQFVHAYWGHGVILSTLAADWRERLRGAWYFPGVRYG